MRLIILKLFFFTLIIPDCRGQAVRFKDSLSFKIRQNFNYDSIYLLDCSVVPAGLYTMWFSINSKDNKVKIIGFSHDSLMVLKQLFSLSLQKSIQDLDLKGVRKKYIYHQQFYFDNFGCEGNNINPDTSTSLKIDDANFHLYAKAIALNILSNTISRIEKSILSAKTHNFSAKKIILLSPVLINNLNPNRTKGWKVDGDNTSKREEQLDFFIKKIQELKDKKKQE